MIDFRAAVQAGVISAHEAELLKDAIREVAPGCMEVEPQALDWAGRIAWNKLLAWQSHCARCGR